MKKIIYLLLMTFSLAVSAVTIEEARDNFSKRGEDVEYAKAAAKNFSDLAELAVDEEEKAKMLMGQSEAVYYIATEIIGKETNNDARVIKHNEGMVLADTALKLIGAENKELKAGLLFWSGAHHAKRALAKGSLAFPKAWKVVKKQMRMIHRLKQSQTNYFGADRIQGRAYHKLPYVLGGSNKKSRKHLEKAYSKTLNVDGVSTHSLNTLYLVELYLDLDEKEKAKKILKAFLEADPKTLNLERVPETKKDQERAKELFDETDWDRGGFLF